VLLICICRHTGQKKITISLSGFAFSKLNGFLIIEISQLFHGIFSNSPCRSLARALMPARITSVTIWSRRIGRWWWSWRSSSRFSKRFRLPKLQTCNRREIFAGRKQNPIKLQTVCACGESSIVPNRGSFLLSLVSFLWFTAVAVVAVVA